MYRYISFFLFCALAFGGSLLEASSRHVTVALLQEEETIQPGRPFWLGLEVACEEGWHIYWKNPGEVGMPFNVDWELPQGFSLERWEWPTPERFETADLVGFGYSGRVRFLALITPSVDLQPGEQAPIKASINWLVCSSLHCEPGAQELTLSLPVAMAEPQKKPQMAPIFEEARVKIPKREGFFKITEQSSFFEIELASEVSGEMSRAVFFADKQQLVDERSPPKINVKGDKTFVQLNKSKPFQPLLEPLTGVLVLYAQEKGQESVHAYEIGFLDTPSTHQEEIAAHILSTAPLYTPPLTDAPSFDSPKNSFEWEGGFWLAMLFAFLGGVLLNLMPCVLPVISFKVMSFVKMAGASRGAILKHGLIFSLGVLCSFWVLASAMLLLRLYGQSVGWGFQLQQPLFVVSLASLLFVFALSLFGVFEWGLSVASLAGQAQAESTKTQEGAVGAFFSGVLATAVATPCSGPFLGSAIGFAVTLPFMASLAIFTSLAMGMCAPYLLLAAFPSFLRFLPKPGPWMETFKQLMGFLLIATVLWLLWVFSYQTDSLSLICLLGGLFCFSLAAWSYGKGSQPMTSTFKRLFAYSATLLFAGLGVQSILLPRDSWHEASSGALALSSDQKDPWDGWENFSIERLEELKKKGTPVFIDFTAKWCLICQANHMVLSSDSVAKQLERRGVVKMKADWTKNDPTITAELSKFGRSSVPLYLFYTGDQERSPLVLPQVLTPDLIAEHINPQLTDEIALRVDHVD